MDNEINNEITIASLDKMGNIWNTAQVSKRPDGKKIFSFVKGGFFLFVEK